MAWLKKAMEEKDERIRKRSEALNLHYQQTAHEDEEELVSRWGGAW